MSSPTVSWIMTCFNVKQYVAESLQSIVSQSFRDFEVVVIDDGSTDGTREYLLSLKDPRIKVFLNETNLGLPRSLNRALRLANGKYIARQDADDISVTHRLEEQVAYMDAHPEVALLGSPAVVIDAMGAEIGQIPVRSGGLRIRWDLMFGNTFVHSSILMRSSVLSSVGQYSESSDVWCVEDYDLWSRIAQRFEVVNLPSPLVMWRRHDDSISATNRRLQTRQASHVQARNIARVLGAGADSPDVDLVLRLHSCSGARGGTLDHAELSRGICALRNLQQRFFAGENLLSREARRQAWNIVRWWNIRLFRTGREGNRTKRLTARVIVLAGALWLLLSFGVNCLRALFRTSPGRPASALPAPTESRGSG